MEAKTESDNTFRRNEEWLNSNYKSLREEYSGKVVAIVEPDNVIVKDNHEELVKDLEEKGIDIELVAVTNIPKKGDVAIV